MIRQIFLLFFILISTSPLSSGLPSRFFLWSVGQGQWATWVYESYCVHFDMGGEISPIKSVKRLCGSKQNRLYLSHGDLDHIQWIPWAAKILPQLCLATWPLEPLSRQKQWRLKTIPRCQDSDSKPKNIDEIPLALQNRHHLSSNDLSHIFVLKSPHGDILIPGDSSAIAERLWASRLNKYNIRKIILGHHGSRSSTSNRLLRHLPVLAEAIVSARKKRYGHPHPSIVDRLRKFGVPTAPTEIWGSISFDL